VRITNQVKDIHTMDRLSMYNAAGNFGSGGYENPTASTRTRSLPELGGGPAPAEFMNGLLDKVKDKADDCGLVIGRWTAAS
jgi:hypothetical protein